MSAAHPTPKVYVATYIALMVLLVATVLVSVMEAGRLATIVALVIAATKGLLVALFFMHLRYSSGVSRIFASVGLVWLIIMFSITLGDYFTRVGGGPTGPLGPGGPPMMPLPPGEPPAGSGAVSSATAPLMEVPRVGPQWPQAGGEVVQTSYLTVDHGTLALDRALGDDGNPGLGDAPVAIPHVRADDQIRIAGLILQGHENQTFCRRGALAVGYQAGDRDPLAVACGVQALGRTDP